MNEIDRCESPIERRMFRALESMVRWNSANLDAEIVPQFRIGRYRADLMIRAVFCHRRPAHVVVECDGKEFHSTPDQMDRDWKRKEDIEAEGFSVIRFSGSEIMKDSKACAEAVLQRIAKVSFYRSAPGNGVL